MSNETTQIINPSQMLLHQSQVSLTDVEQPGLMPTMTRECTESISSPDQSNSPIQITQVPLPPVTDQLITESNQSIIDFDDTEADSYKSNVPQYMPTASVIPTDITESTAQPQNESTPTQTFEPKIPLSHLIAHNQYPSLSRPPPANIVQSFSPVFVNASQSQANTIEELYSSYVNNPYNLTLHVEQTFSGDQKNENLTATDYAPTANIDASKLPEAPELNEQLISGANMNVFQSATYFGTTSDTTIPPGSEMLFGQP